MLEGEGLCLKVFHFLAPPDPGKAAVSIHVSSTDKNYKTHWDGPVIQGQPNTRDIRLVLGMEQKCLEHQILETPVSMTASKGLWE